ncbi:MAG: 5-carboxymethyl-2-hydroxymuconate semialdehyde dehydrogenase, partial [Planktomarina temperata]|nr:5-carboxymethyl-2-hydroxymuconate semialdehyde dehydrogenase [Planktomarina temperata]
MSALEQNIEKLNGHLARFQRSGILHRIAGADHAGGGGVFQTLSPVDKSIICQV